MKTILLKFAGPLQSWGTRSHFETRHTDLYPSKSAVIGIIAASMGFRRDDDTKIQVLNCLDFAVRIDQSGQLLRDYHTAVKYKNNGVFERTYVTNRYYLEDAVFVVAIGQKDDAFIDKIVEGLQKPYFQPFMGRRSLPPTADFFLGIYNTDVIAALSSCPWQAREAYQRSHSNRLSVYSDSDLGAEGVQSGMRKDYVISFSQENRQFGFRSELKIEVTVPKPYISTEHDAFDALGG
ncbi:MAG: type I-E CRISPR-associated protein Cas5/CasD [Saccharofermentanales bacterium]|jgi:CRISPR system Cascade subunit CasD|nr:type I-E CRISPR-associated protein Cas5/CasD [Clostridiaceae bacterium]